MALLIDTPRWRWRGRLWAHLISDESLDELHDAAELLGLRYLSFGCDHYDVPETIWTEACGRAELVDSRQIVRTLRQSGLRVPGGKNRKAWRPLDVLPPSMRPGEVDDWLRAVALALDGAAVEYLARPGELVVLHLLDGPQRPVLGGLADGPAHPAASVRHTVADRRYSLELIIDEARLRA